MSTCRTCPRPAVVSIHSTLPPGKSRVHTLYTDPSDAPCMASDYCAECASSIMRGIINLTEMGATS